MKTYARRRLCCILGHRWVYPTMNARFCFKCDLSQSRVNLAGHLGVPKYKWISNPKIKETAMKKPTNVPLKEQVISYITEENRRGRNPMNDEIATALGLPMQKAFEIIHNDLSANRKICWRCGWIVCSNAQACAVLPLDVC